MSNDIDIANANSVLNKYISLMWEMKKREEAIKCIIKGDCNVMYPQIALETVFFQLRKMIEIIAMSPMLINEQEYRLASKNPEFNWRLKDIIKNLSAANPNYYPQPIKIIKEEGKMDRFEGVNYEFISKDDLLDIYSHCSDFAHLKNPLKEHQDDDFLSEIKFVSSSIKKIHDLLQTHKVNPLGNENFYYICMSGEGKRPHGTVFGVVGKLTEEKERIIVANNGKLPDDWKE